MKPLGMIPFLALAIPSIANVDRPNILMIAVDDLKPTIGAYGDPYAITPAMDLLAARGALFTNAHCQQAVCGPSRASLLTGLRPDTVRVWDLATRMRDQVPDLVTLPQHFKRQGYHTASLGKLFDSRCCDGWATNDVPSWSRPHFNPNTPHLTMGMFGDPTVAAVSETHRAAALARGEADRGLNTFKPATERLARNVPDNFYGDGLCADEAIRLLGELRQGDTPFFLAVGFVKPHLPFIAPKKYWDLYDREKLPLATIQEMPLGAPGVHFQDSLELRGGYGGIPAGRLPDVMQRELIHGYYACVSYVDAQIGRLLAALEAEGLAENTIIVLWGDHGFHLGDHGMWCKHTNYEQATRVPLLIVDPRRPATAKPITRPVELIDLAPTLTELARITNYNAFEGKSLAPLLTDADAPFKRFAVSQYPRARVTGGHEDLMGYAFRDERYRLVVWIEKDFRAGERDGRCVATELYDYGTDPLETRNLAADPAFDQLTRHLKRDAASYAVTELAMSWTDDASASLQ